MHGQVRVHAELAIFNVVEVAVTPPVEIPILGGQVRSIAVDTRRRDMRDHAVSHVVIANNVIDVHLLLFEPSFR